MKHLLTLTLFLGIAWGQSELMGTWSKHYTTFVSKKIIYKSNGKQYFEEKTFTKSGVLDNSFINRTYILHDPWIGESYYELPYLNEKDGKRAVNKVKVSLIDSNTMLIGNTKYYKE